METKAERYYAKPMVAGSDECGTRIMRYSDRYRMCALFWQFMAFEKGSNRDVATHFGRLSGSWLQNICYRTVCSHGFYRTQLSGRLPFEVKGQPASTSHTKRIYSRRLVTRPVRFYLPFIEQTFAFPSTVFQSKFSIGIIASLQYLHFQGLLIQNRIIYIHGSYE